MTGRDDQQAVGRHSRARPSATTSFGERIFRQVMMILFDLRWYTASCFCPSCRENMRSFAVAVFKIFCKCAKRGTQRISRARGLRLRACANAATASAAWPWQVAGEMLKWGTDGRPMKVLIPVTVGTISIAFSRRSVKAGVERTLSLRPRMVNRRSACQDT